MANSNEHVEQFLNYYLEKEASPDYAVLITGCWGSGKTYFIKQFLAGKDPNGKNKDVVKISDWLTDCEKYAVVYVSLFGAKSRAEMDQRVLEKFLGLFHQILRELWLALLGMRERLLQIKLLRHLNKSQKNLKK